MGREVPAVESAEQAVLGAMLQAGHVIPDVTDALTGSDYYWPKHEAVHDVIVDLWQRQEPVDPVTVAAELARRGFLDRVGGGPYLHTLLEACPVAASATYYADQVLDAARRRRLLDAGARIMQVARESGDSAQATQDARQMVEEAAGEQGTRDGGTLIGDGLDDAIDWLETPPVGADTPWVDVNYKTNGLLAGQMVTVAARPGHGKSLCLKDVALFTAKQGKPVHIATLEMSRHEYMARILAGEAKVDLGKMLRRELDDRDWALIGEAAEKVRGLPLYLDDRENQSMAQIRAAARSTSRRYGQPLGLIGIDYCQLVRPADRRIVREQQVAQISRDTKLLAKEHDCPVMLLAQLNRGNTQRTDPTPVVSDLRESGALEQDSDQVWLLHRPDQYGVECERPGEVDLIVGKNRNGPAPTVVSLAFQGHYARIVSAF